MVVEKIENFDELELLNQFNREARRRKIRYRMIMREGIFNEDITLSYVIGFENTFLRFYLKINEIKHRDNSYIFKSPLPIKLFEKIEGILNKLNFNFKLRVKEGELSSQYKIINKL